MNRPVSSFPVGVRPLLFEEADRRRRIEAPIIAALEARSYREIILPIVDFVDPYAGLIDEETLRRSYRFTDREGELLSIRADFTPLVARVLAPSIAGAELPVRLYYRGDVIRCEPSRLGRDRELFQIGAELVGDASVEADLEIIRLAAGVISERGFEPMIALSDASLIPALLREASLEDGEVERLLASLRAGSLEQLPGLSPVAQQLVRLMQSGEVEELLDHPGAARLRTAFDAIGKSANTVAILDPRESGYYSGIRFQIFSDPRKAPVASGGRYDGLFARFGADVPAVGFTMNLDVLEER